MEFYLNKERYRLQISSRKYIELKYEELQVLQQLTIHGTVNSFILHDLFKGIVNPSFSSTTISNRIRKFVDYHILVRLEESITINHFTHTVYYYKLGENGLYLLQEFLHLDSYDLYKVEEDAKRQSIPSTNEIILSTLANDIYLNSIRCGAKIQYAKFRDHWLSILRSTKGDKIFSDAWVFESEDQLILLILNAPIRKDTNMEGIFTNILNLFARESVREDKHCIVIFSVTNQVRNFYTKNTRDVIFDLKAWMPYFTQWHPNLEVYVLAFDRLKERIGALLRFVDEEAGYKYLLPRNFQLILEQKNEEDFKQYSFSTVRSFSANKIGFQTFHLFKKQKDTRYVISIAGLEGSVKTYQTAASLEKQLSNLGYLYDEVPIHLFVIYRDQESQENDIIRSYHGKNIWLTSLQYMQLVNEPIKNLELTHLVGLQKRKNQPFYL